ncbi:MAG TPA: hypothetical protein PLJ27_01850 [Polyangiaceae bacterium]|jgi:aspartyl/glutamyl-tRNA(Asn/Gln) amidotransferase C subunit|nr:MAG: aspartyl/glutamyl-tRNA amidotransferase subunit C [Deltaproteobacteria bacterium ADurb.Bin207]HNS98039.1 hypothetical protein [Polyangiaceae bacterium]HNZ24731.1 hypothetical protein [Polyangiaceae bacterium]HOD24912.1 hypothetical protein [Polyangiaceae bacterium]HOE51137.1 hypothetical protein [Polyangiaceae bacterium]
MPAICTESIRRIARSASLHLENDEVENMARDLSKDLEALQGLREIDFEGPSLDDEKNVVLRRDTPEQSLSMEQVKSQSERATPEGFRVPPFLPHA